MVNTKTLGVFMSNSVLINNCDEFKTLISSILLSQQWPDSAAALHGMAIKAFKNLGFIVYPEFRLYVPSYGKNGKIDLVIQLDSQFAAIEFDTRKPRRKSIEKLKLFNGYRVIALRGVSGHVPIPEIDLIIGMPVRLATREEQQDKRTIRRP
jgi:hypothetical protein